MHSRQWLNTLIPVLSVVGSVSLHCCLLGCAFLCFSAPLEMTTCYTTADVVLNIGSRNCRIVANRG